MTHENPVERVQEEVIEHGHHATESWIMGVALTAAILAVFAAISALLAEHRASEAMLDQIRSSDQWNFYQAKSLKESLLQTRIQLLEGLGRPADSKDREKLDRYVDEKKEIKEKAEELEHHSRKCLEEHKSLSFAVTLFQVAIGIGAISVLTKQRLFWYVSIAFGLGGIGFWVSAFMAPLLTGAG